jgi:uncharacterized protein YktB (UPF0637 family)
MIHPKSLAHKLKDALFRKTEDFLYWIAQKRYIPRSTWLGITYDNEKHTDGAGAQLQRIYGIYSVARLLRVVYIHSPLLKLDYQGLTALESNSSNHNVVSEYNHQFCISSDVDLPEKHETRHLVDVNLKQLIQLKKEAKKKKTFILAKILYPYGITDAYPECYGAVQEISPFSTVLLPSVIRVAIHIRRGELFVVDSHRMLPNEYYLAVIHQIREIFDQLALKYEFELYTEIPQKAFTVSPIHHGIANRIADPVVVDPKLNKIEEFDTIPNLKKFINADPIETLKGMSSANILVMSHSSFSYLASILNHQGIIMYHDFWHKPLKRWLNTSDSGSFSKELFIEQLLRITNQSK